MHILKTTVWSEPSIIPTIIKNTPTLDPLVILMNSVVYVIKNDNRIIGFASIKKFNNTTELGTVFVYPEFRGHGYAETLIKEITNNIDSCFLLCHPHLIPFYEKCNFRTTEKSPAIIRLRQKLFHLFLAPMFGYKICVMELHK
jgi:GNAT superfamily N-acetyltransferase